MLYCNDELVNINDPQWEYLKKEFAEIRKKKNPIRIKTTQKVIINPTGFAEVYPAQVWPLQTTVINEHGQSETWVYTKNTPRWEKDTLIYSERSILITHGFFTLNPLTETDKSFFLLKLSPLLKTGLYEIEDLEKRDTEQVNKIGANAALEYFICNKYSPLYKNTKRTRLLAASWGISYSDSMHIDSVRKLLLEKVYASQRNYKVTNRGIDEFIAEVNGEDPFSEYRSLLQSAIDNKIIQWNDKDKGWYFMDTNTNTFVQPIIFVPTTQSSQRQYLLFEHVKMNATLFQTIQVALENNKKQNIEMDGSEMDDNEMNIEETTTSLDHLEWKTLRRIAIKRGIFEKSDDRESVINKLLNLRTTTKSS